MKQIISFSRTVTSVVLIGLANITIAIDPMAPPGYRAKITAEPRTKPNLQPEEQSKQGLSVQQIVIKKHHRSAVINNTLVAEGDTIGDAKIISIATESVIVSVAGQRKEISVRDDYPKVKATPEFKTKE